MCYNKPILQKIFCLLQQTNPKKEVIVFMKYLVILGDGMADTPVPELGGQTPLMAAKTEHLDRLAKSSTLGMVKTVPEHFAPGSDVANLSVMGYAPERYYTGRSPLEAISMGLSLANEDVTLRCNTVTLSEEEPFEAKTMIDYSADEITTAESARLIEAVQKALGDELFTFYSGISYRHCLVWKSGHTESLLTPPHDITLRPIASYLPKGKDGEKLLSLMKKSYEILKDHPVNQARVARGLKPANAIWLWGSGKKTVLPAFSEMTGKTGCVISAVDLVKGIGLAAGMEVPNVPGVTGNVHTDFDAKRNAALEALEKGADFVYLHMEAPDEAGHRHEVDNKVLSIEKIDRQVIGPICQALETQNIPFRMLVLPDHPTPLAIRTHSSDPVPFLFYDSTHPVCGKDRYHEISAAETGLFYPSGPALMERFLSE